MICETSLFKNFTLKYYSKIHFYISTTKIIPKVYPKISFHNFTFRFLTESVLSFYNFTCIYIILQENLSTVNCACDS